jgi:hypothetical protein
MLCRPFESGEVTVQPYNTLLSVASLVEVSSGILLLQNETLAATCSRLLGIQHPSFKVGAVQISFVEVCYRVVEKVPTGKRYLS